MLVFIQNLYWFSVSVKCHIPVEDARTVIPELAKRFINLKLNINEIAPQLRESVFFYIENIDILKSGD